MTQIASLPPEIRGPVPTDEHARYEIVNGQRVEMPPMGAYPNWVASLFLLALGSFAKAHQLGRATGETLFTLDPQANLRRRPDVSFVSYQRWPRRRQVPTSAAWDVVPELLVEVVSPNDLFEEVVGKVGEYFRAGVLLVWVVLPSEKQVYVYESPTRIRVLTHTEELDGGTVLPGLRLPLAPLFDDEAEGEG